METIDRVKALVGDQVGCPASEIDSETPFKELDLDSLDRIELGMAIEEHFHLDIPDVDMENEAHGTPAGIAAYLDSRKDDWGTFTGLPHAKAMNAMAARDAVELQGVGVVEKMKTAQEAFRANAEREMEKITNGQPTGIEGKCMPIYGIRKADFDELRRLVQVPVNSTEARFRHILDGIAAEESKSRGYEV